MKRAMIGAALMLAILPAPAFADDSDYTRDRAQCDAAIDARDYPSMAAYCAIASEDFAMIEQRVPADSAAFDERELLRANLIYFSAMGYAHFDRDHAVEQFQSVATILRTIITYGRLSPENLQMAQQLNSFVEKHLGDLE
jgi:hypothetical protein